MIYMGRFLALYTGGKDSHTAMLIAMKDLGMEPSLLLTIITPRDDSYLLHTINTRWAGIHASLMSIPIKIAKIDGHNEEDEVLKVIESSSRETGADAIITGGIASMYQKKRFDKIARSLGLDHIAPLWGLDQERVLKLEVLEYNVKFSIIAAMAMGLTEEWLGKMIEDKEDVEILIRLAKKYMFSPVGEGGEYESFVVSSPLFRCKRLIPVGKKVWFSTGWGYYEIHDIRIEKGCF
jgi:ABC transporter with metal-binding/Fe-S-binding domain ATP-binding protein